MFVLLAGMALAASQDLPPYAYSRTYEHPVEDRVTFTRWAPGHVLHAAVPVALRAVADPDGRPIGTVPAGGEVEIVAVGADATVEGMTNAWYEVRAGSERGWVFGAALTPIAVTADLDLDGKPDVATVAFTPDHRIRVRVGEKFLDLDTVGGDYLSERGGAVYLRGLVPAEKVGVPLLHLRAGVEANADYAEYWVSFGKDGPVLSHRDKGLTYPPACTSFEPTYEPGTMVMTYTDETCDPMGMLDKPEPTRTRKQVYRLVDGRFR